MPKLPNPSSASGETTSTDAGWLGDENARPQVTAVLALVVAWSLEEPWRIGEALLFAPDGPTQLFGRGGPEAADEAPRARLVRQRPGEVAVCPPLSAGGLSRRQLRITPQRGGLHFERIGRSVTRVNGLACESGVVGPNDVLAVDGQLVFLCVERTTQGASARNTPPFPFGGADADGIVGESDAAFVLRAELASGAASGMHSLVLGETGTGKELAARALHRMSARAGRPFVARNAAAIPASLLDAELFGNRRDYPNSGMPERDGVVGAAHGGTLFLDEIGELAPELQTHLLRLLDAGGEYHRLGDSIARRSDLRLLAATNRAPFDLKTDFVARFPVRVSVPGLDGRREDIPLILRHVLSEIAETHADLRERFFESSKDGSSTARVDPAFVEALLSWRWTSHVRELRALVWSSLRSSRGAFLTTPPEMAASLSLRAPDGGTEAPPNTAHEPSPQAIRQALAMHQGNQSKAYLALGLPSRFALYRLLRKFGIDARGARRR